jgi:predicted nuclease of restriction endonuclease-like (RecB) superfamily
MREFYTLYRGNPKVQPLVAQIGWTHNLIIVQRCKAPLEREFYIRMTRKFGWSKNVLIHQIENQAYEKTLLGQTNFDQAVAPELRSQAKLVDRHQSVQGETPHGCRIRPFVAPDAPSAWPPIESSVGCPRS